MSIIFVICRRKNASQAPQQQQHQQQQQQAEPNIYSVQPIVPSAPPLETLYDSRTESVIVQGSVLSQENTEQETPASRNTPTTNTNDEHVYTALTNTSGSIQPGGIDNPSYDTQESTLSTSPSGSADPVQYAVVKLSLIHI